MSLALARTCRWAGGSAPTRSALQDLFQSDGHSLTKARPRQKGVNHENNDPTGCEAACDGRSCTTDGGIGGNCLITNDTGECRCVLEVTPTATPAMPTPDPSATDPGACTLRFGPRSFDFRDVPIGDSQTAQGLLLLALGPDASATKPITVNLLFDPSPPFFDAYAERDVHADDQFIDMYFTVAVAVAHACIR
jgi:hypothetical protein